MTVSTRSWMISLIRYIMNESSLLCEYALTAQKCQFVGLKDFHCPCLLHFVSVIQWIQLTTGRWKETEWRYMTALCEAKEVDRQVSKKLPALPLCDLWAVWVAAGTGDILQQLHIYRIVAHFLAVWCKVHKDGGSPWTSLPRGMFILVFYAL